MREKSPLLQRDGAQKILASLLSIFAGLVIGSIVVVLVGLFNDNIGPKAVWEGVRLVFAGILSTGRAADGSLSWGFNSANIGNMFFRATPLIMTGLSVALAFKTGLFNIGAPGQYLMGTVATLCVALGIPAGSLPGFVIWLLAFLCGMLAGAVWGAIPGFVKAYLNINEVLACIMTNWIAANVVTWIFEASNFKNVVEGTKTAYIYKTTYGLTYVDGAPVYVEGLGVATAKLGLDRLFPGSQINGGILVAILLAFAVHVIISKTTFGYELKACGANRHAARYAGIKDKRNIVLSMSIAGALAAAGASLYYLSGNTEFFWNTYQALPSTGFNGIPVALLALNEPIAVIFTGIFMAMLNIVGLQLTNLTAYNEYITDVIISVIVYLSAFSLLIRVMLTDYFKRRRGEKSADEDAAPESEPSEEAPEGETIGDVPQLKEGGEEA